jgi:hypothetical protein
MDEYAAFSAAQLLALIAVNFGPLKKCADGRWRSAWQSFPAAGLDDDEVCFLSDHDLVEMAFSIAIVTERGRCLMRNVGAVGELPATPALRGASRAPLLLQ